MNEVWSWIKFVTFLIQNHAEFLTAANETWTEITDFFDDEPEEPEN